MSLMMKSALALGSLLLAFGTASAQTQQKPLRVYTDRPLTALKEITPTFQNATGIQVEWVEASAEQIVEKVRDANLTGQADVVYTKDLVYFHELTESHLLQPMTESDQLKKVDARYRHSQNLWTGISLRARTFVYASDEVGRALTHYADLAQPQWAGQLCVRRSASTYNQALVASFIESAGADATVDMLTGWMDNLAENPFDNDRAILRAVSSGRCAVGVVNTYYLAAAIANDPGFPVKPFLALPEVHTNGTGAGIAAGSTRPQDAQKLIEFLLEPTSQEKITAAHMDYPIRSDVAPTTLIRDWAPLHPSTLTWEQIGKRLSEVPEVLERAGY